MPRESKIKADESGNTRWRLEDEANRVVHALKGRWQGHMAMCHCPAHNDRTPSLSVSIGERAVLFHCFAGCSQSDILDALGSVRRDRHVPPTSVRKDRRRSEALFEIAERLWTTSIPAHGTIGETYLKRRGISPLPDSVRFQPKATTNDRNQKVSFPALILPIANDDGLTGIQRVFLDADGGKAPIAEPKLSLGARRQDGAIRYGGLPVHGTLNLAEGFEDAHSAMLLNGLDHCWSVCGIERYQRVGIPTCVRNIHIWSQHGPEAKRAIERARPHLTMNDRRLQVSLPPPGGDWNDALVASLGLRA